MDAARYRRIEEVFAACRDLPHQEQAAYLDETCRGDVELRNAVEQILHECQTPDTFLDRARAGAAAVAASAIGDHDDEHLPSVIGPYHVVRRLGAGGMGIVYLAEQEQPRRRVAVKVLRPGAISSQALRRFELEAQVLGQLQHPGIAHIYEARTTGAGVDRRSYFAMEYVDGVPLTTYASREELGTRSRLALIAGVCDAVHHAHQKGVIHRDLKPGNILVDTSGQPKILDFGVARATDADVQTVSLQTDVGQLIGTIPYMSPEQVTGVSRDLDIRSDVYALGVMTYELLAGKLPHDVRERSIPEAARMIREDEPATLSSINPHLRGDVETIVAKALEKEKDRRYSSAAELVADIRRYLQDEPISARPASATYQLRKFARRNRGLVLGMGVAVIALIAGSVIALWQAVEARAAQRIAEERFSDTRALARIFMFDHYDHISTLANSLEARKFLVQTALEYANKLAAQRTDDIELHNDIIKAYLRISTIQGRPDTPNTGDLDGAIASATRALELAEEGVRRWPHDPDSLHNVGLAHEALAELSAARGRFDEAEAHGRKCIEIIEQVVARLPPDDPQRRDLALAHHKLGRLYERRGATADALREYEASHRLRKELLSGTESKGALLDVATSGSKLGDMLMRTGDYERALERFGESHALRRRVVEADPDDLRALRAFSLTYGRIGQALLTLGREDEARSHFEEYLGIRQRLAQAAPDDASAQRDLAVAYYRMGELDYDAGHGDAALDQFTHFIQILERLSIDSPNDVRLKCDIAAGQLKAAMALILSGRVEEAVTLMRSSLDRANVVLEGTPDYAEAWEIRISAQIEIGKVHLGNKSHDAARDVVEHALTDIARRSEGGDVNVQLDHLKADALRVLGQVYDAWSTAEGLTEPTRQRYRTAACEQYRSCQTWMREIRDRGALRTSYHEMLVVAACP